MHFMHRGRMLWKFYELVMKMLSDLHNFLQIQIFRLKNFPSDLNSLQTKF